MHVQDAGVGSRGQGVWIRGHGQGKGTGGGGQGPWARGEEAVSGEWLVVSG